MSSGLEFDEGKEPWEVKQQLVVANNGRNFKYDGDEIYCDICGKLFETSGARNFHKSSYHNNNSQLNNPHKQWDFGQLDLRKGVDALWNDFMHEHDLPKVVFLFGPPFLLNRKAISTSTGKIMQGYSYMPRYYKDKVLDTYTGIKHDAIVFPEEWLMLDMDAKAVSLAHVAIHVENYRHDISDLAFVASHRHNKMFKNVAWTYDLFVMNVPIRGYAILRMTPKFRRKHKYALRMLARYHHLKVVNGHRTFQCHMGRYEEDDMFKYMEQWTDFDNVIIP